MRVAVKFHRRAEPSLREWRDRILATPPGDPRMPQVLVDELVGQFERTQGLPPGCQWRRDLDPPGYVWRYAGDAWVHYLLRGPDHRTREVLVLGVTPEEPR
jgi:hypothetical protein